MNLAATVQSLTRRASDDASTCDASIAMVCTQTTTRIGSACPALRANVGMPNSVAQAPVISAMVQLPEMPPLISQHRCACQSSHSAVLRILTPSTSPHSLLSRAGHPVSLAPRWLLLPAVARIQCCISPADPAYLMQLVRPTPVPPARASRACFSAGWPQSRPSAGPERRAKVKCCRPGCSSTTSLICD